ncbi:MAG TPA: hypothetical protein VD932_03740 [Aquabacterium sp.]|nr:hypothetical protein [Aquabacterium sp.]
MDLIDTMRRLYDAEINCGMETFFAGGIHVWLGDEHNGHKADEWFDWDELDQIPGWLDREARRLYPGSAYDVHKVAIPGGSARP